MEMAMSTSGIQRRSLNTPDEVRPFENDSGELSLVTLEGAGSVGRATFKPGWKWSKDVKPIANTEMCEAPHFMYQLSGRMHIEMKDGTAVEVGPGDVAVIPPGHDAWVVGNEPVVAVDWSGAANYAKK
jgi:mannose-6-phosphate isomerase-like protein (cupin superfamily)